MYSVGPIPPKVFSFLKGDLNTRKTHAHMHTHMHAYILYVCMYTSLYLRSSYERKCVCLSASCLFRVTTPSFIHFLSDIIISFFFMAEYSSFVHIYYMFSVHSSVEGYHWLNLITVMNSAAIISTCVSAVGLTSALDIYPGMVWLGYGSSFCSFEKPLH